jgi:FixJ family two-component response regulator
MGSVSGSRSVRFLVPGVIPKHNCANPGPGLSLDNMSTGKEARVVAIVDDDESVREAVSALIQNEGIPTLAFASAEGFLRSSELKRVGCLVTDIRMPGMSGLELQSKLNRDRYTIPIIFITAHGDEKVRMQALRSGAVEFLVKPFDDEALLESVRAAVSS